MKISIIIPSLNSKTIDKTISSLLSCDRDAFDLEIIVVGIDEPGLISSSDVILFDKTERPYGPAAARNRGAAQATGEIFIFLDSDCVVSQNWLKNIQSNFENSKIAGVCGGVRFKSTNYWNVADNFSLFHDFLYTNKAGFRVQLPSFNFAIRRNIFIEMNGFTENYPLPAGEDFDLTLRITKAGYTLYFDPQAWVLHIPERNSFSLLWKHAYNIGAYSTKINPLYKDETGFPGWMRNRQFLYLSSPVLAMIATLNVYLTTSFSYKYILSFPAVFISKVAWCIGASNSPFLH
jgi:cellulose synthase/poly-beta-1,6-N-acetylglucosamine synthase-like glycosyltransferase